MDDEKTITRSAKALTWLRRYGGDAVITRKTNDKTVILASGRGYAMSTDIWQRLADAGEIEFYDQGRRLRTLDANAASHTNRARLSGPLTPAFNVFDPDSPATLDCE